MKTKLPFIITLLALAGCTSAAPLQPNRFTTNTDTPAAPIISGSGVQTNVNGTLNIPSQGEAISPTVNGFLGVAPIALGTSPVTWTNTNSVTVFATVPIQVISGSGRGYCDMLTSNSPNDIVTNRFYTATGPVFISTLYTFVPVNSVILIYGTNTEVVASNYH